MSYVVIMKDNSNDDVRGLVINREWSPEEEFLWEEGNFSCDCNRFLLFYDDPSNPTNEEKCPCGDTRFTVLEIGGY